MTNPTSRAVASVAIAAGCGAIAFASPVVAGGALIALVFGLYFIWEAA